MRRLALSASAFALCVGVASAADLPAYEAAPMIPVADAGYDWSGLYLGVHAGYGWGDADYVAAEDLPSPPFDTIEETVEADGWLGGGQVGFNAQFGSIVAGVEADLSWTGIDGEGVAIDDEEAPSVASFDLDWYSTIRGRLGFTADRFLVYGTAGVAFASVEAGVTNAEGAGDDREDDQDYMGWVVGAGVEAAFTPNLSAKLEYQYADLGSEEFNFGDFYGAGDLVADADLHLHTVRVGLNYRFGGF